MTSFAFKLVYFPEKIHFMLWAILSRGYQNYWNSIHLLSEWKTTSL